MKSFIEISEKKDHIIKKLKNLSQDEKDMIIRTFKRKPHLEDLKDKDKNPLINWQDKNLTFQDFLPSLSYESKRGKKKAVRDKGIKGLKAGKDYIPLKIKSDMYLAYVPLTPEASKLIASTKIGECEGKWCISQNDNIFHWNFYVIENGEVPVMVLGEGSKWSVMVKRGGKFNLWDKKDSKINHIPIDGIDIQKDIINPNKSIINKIRDEHFQKNFVGDAKTKDADYLFGEGEMLWIDGTWYDGRWHFGMWEKGTWFDGSWNSGEWMSGDWHNGWWGNGVFYDGTWHNGWWQDGEFNAVWLDGTWEEGDFRNAIWKNGIWKGGRWKNSTWYNGTWEKGRWNSGLWKDGTFNGGYFYAGTWMKGTWNDGKWHGGTWMMGNWRNGEWLDGRWEEGVHGDGIWHNGTWVNGMWMGGIWKNGVWKNGSWVSGTWQDGLWAKGDWNGGEWVSGTWLDGVWEKGTWISGTWKGGTWKGGEWISGFDADGNFHDKGDSPDKWNKE